MKKLIKSMIPYALKIKYREYINEKYIRSFEGDNVFCTICNSKFRVFAPFGTVINRKNARCLRCGSLERHRLIWKYITEKLNIINSNKTLKLLHFAPEKMLYDVFRNVENIDYVPCDLHPEMYKFKVGTEIVKVDITNIPFETGSFDFILCNHVLEHIPNDRLAMSELFRTMKIGGNGIFQVPVDYERDETYEDFTILDPKERKRAFGQEDHVRWYGKDYKRKLESVGFSVTEDDFVNNFSPEEQFKYGFIDSEKIYHCEK